MGSHESDATSCSSQKLMRRKFGSEKAVAGSVETNYYVDKNTYLCCNKPLIL